MKKTMISVAVLALSASLAFAAHDGGDSKGGRHRGGFAKMAEKLNLTDLQKQQIRDIQNNFREQNKAFFESVRATRKEFRAAKEANDQGKLDVLKPAMEAQHAQLKQLRDAERDQIRSILTAEQRAQFDAMKAQHKQRRTDKQ